MVLNAFILQLRTFTQYIECMLLLTKTTKFDHVMHFLSTIHELLVSFLQWQIQRQSWTIS